jgi:hypothetical protein
MNKWESLGQLLIDHGEMVLMDRSYLHEVPDPDDEGDESLLFVPVVNDFGIELGMVMSTGIGDGVYPIEARFEDTAFGRKIAEVRIRFLPHPELGDDIPVAGG